MNDPGATHYVGDSCPGGHGADAVTVSTGATPKLWFYCPNCGAATVGTKSTNGGPYLCPNCPQPKPR